MARPTKFGQFARALRELAKVPSAVAKGAARDIQQIVRRNFASGVDPYGRPYAALTAGSLRRGRRPPPLRKFRARATVKPLAAQGIAVTINHPQAGFHQTGTQHMAKRIVFPDGAVPAAWRAVIARRLKAEIRKRVRRAA